MTNDLMTVSQAMKKYGVTRQAIYLCIYNNRLKAVKDQGRWKITEKAWDDYTKSKYDRMFSVSNGEKIYDPEHGILSPGMVSSMFNLDRQKIYYLIRKNVIPAEKCGCSYVLKIEDIELHKEKIFVKKFKRYKCKK